MNDHVRRWQALGEAGVIVSIVYGPMGGGRLLFSVDAMSATGDGFPKPYAAETFEQAVEIAEKESHKRGWLKTNLWRRGWRPKTSKLSKA